jgi:hypothetical protein
MKTKSWKAFSLLFLFLAALSGCQTQLQGAREDDIYYSPKAAYGVPLYLSPFRGNVEVYERCNSTGGSTTFWDEQGRYFRVDYLKIDENPMALAPRFASDQTMLNSVMNNYLRDVLPSGTAIEDIDTTVREFLKDRDPRALFVILNMNVDSTREGNVQNRTLLSFKDIPLVGRNLPLAGGQSSVIRGTYYYGFLLFKRGEFIYVVQHYQPSYMRDKMLQVLTRMADNMIVPGKARSDSEFERARARWNSTVEAVNFRSKPAETEDGVPEVNPIRPCD